MANLMYEVHFWTIKDKASNDDKQLGKFVYHDKRKTDEEFPYRQEKKDFCSSRGIIWSPSNKRPHKVSDNLKLLEDYLADTRVVTAIWTNQFNLLLVFSCGMFIVLTVNLKTGDIENVNIDRSLVGKLYSENISDVVLGEKFIALTYTEPKLTFLPFGKTNQKNIAEEKLSSKIVNFVNLDLYGPSARRIERNLSYNIHQNTLLVWWHSTSNEVWPWTPASVDRDRANIFVYTVCGPRIELLCCLRQEADPLYAKFSSLHPDHILTVEESPSHASDNARDTYVRIYEISSSKLNRIESVSAPIPGPMTKASWNCNEDKIAIICKNGFLVVVDRNMKMTKVVKLLNPPTFINWHIDGSILCVCDQKGLIQFFDYALNEMKVQLNDEDSSPSKVLELFSYMISLQTPIQSVLWYNTFQKGFSNSDAAGIFVLLNRGPMVYVKIMNGLSSTYGRIDPSILIAQYIDNVQLTNAVNLLTCVNWNSTPNLCYKSVSRIVTYLLCQPLTSEVEGLIEAALGTFYNLNNEIIEEVVAQYRHQIGVLARRFFHHLLRNERVEKAFLLAVDINSADLFLDIYHYGIDRGEMILAETAKAKADEIIDSGCSDSDSASSSDSFDSSDSDEEYVAIRSLKINSHPTQQLNNRAGTSNENRRHQRQQATDIDVKEKPTSSDANLYRHTMSKSHNVSYPWHSKESVPKQMPPREVHITIDPSSQSEDEEISVRNSARVLRTDENRNSTDSDVAGEEENPTGRDSSSVKVIHFGIV